MPVSPLPPLPERETLRLHQANERTHLAWIRTAIAMMGFGFIVARFGLFLRELASAHGTTVPASAPWSLYLGVALAAVGVITVLAATARYRTVGKAIERHEVGAPGDGAVILASIAAGILGLAVVVVLIVTG